ncbi:probable carboxylesterase 2 [Oryza sativa Japonica Group]|uniref:probable carboxylesterase 2 n=1 Tax=Oryza sativa subsp. japonica TaxID=39947 RepID=UPI00339CBAA8
MEAAGGGQRRHLEVEARRAAPGSRPPCQAPPREPYGLHAARVMVSRDVHLSASSFVRLYLPPPAAGDKRLPVVVYFHGGGFVIGSAASPGYRRCLNDLAAACPAVTVSVATASPWSTRSRPRTRTPPQHSPGSPSAARRRHGEQKGLWEFVCPDAADGADDPQMNPTAAGAPGLENLVCEKVMVCVAEGNTLRWRGRAYAVAVTSASRWSRRTSERRPAKAACERAEQRWWQAGERAGG